MNDALRRALASRHGLDPETATEDAIEAAELAAASPEGGAPEGEGSPEGGAEPVTPEAVPAGVAARTVTVSREQWERTEAAAREGAQARAAQIAADRDGRVRAAIADGRITPAEAGLDPQADGTLPNGWRRDMDEAPEVTARALDRLERGRYPGATARQGVSPQEGAANAGAGLARARAGLGIRKPQEVK